MRKYRNDILLIIGLVLLAVLGVILYFALQQKDNLIVRIYYDKDLVEEISISEEKELFVHDVVILIKNKEVYVQSSICKDQICVHQGKIKSAGQTITCLPQRVFIQIEGSGVDVGV
ncbi:MAG: NusG domain II-containing protein [Anaeroplasmataceae bacterium]|nr:NusG domain II-containing protein [Anaeroplasmataceae bacterium]